MMDDIYYDPFACYSPPTEFFPPLDDVSHETEESLSQMVDKLLFEPEPEHQALDLETQPVPLPRGVNCLCYEKVLDLEKKLEDMNARHMTLMAKYFMAQSQVEKLSKKREANSVNIKGEGGVRRKRTKLCISAGNSPEFIVKTPSSSSHYVQSQIKKFFST